MCWGFFQKHHRVYQIWRSVGVVLKAHFLSTTSRFWQLHRDSAERYNMDDRLSSSLTVYHKMLLPALWIAGFGFGTLAIWLGHFDQPSQPPEEVKLLFLLSWIIGSVFMLRDTVRLKTVDLGINDLIIKNFTGVIRVPLRNVNHVSESRLSSPKTISLTVYPPCEFGDRITFIPKLTFQMSFRLLREHPIVTRLRALTGVLE